MWGEWLTETVETRRRHLPPAWKLVFWGWLAGLVTMGGMVALGLTLAALNCC